jgi:hypothetical protein
MPQNATINYLSRNYSQIRQELINFLKQNYPEIKDYNDASIGMALLELNAAVGDILSYHTDRMFNETQLDYIQERKNLLALARTYGLKVGGKKPSITVLSLSVNVRPSTQTAPSNCVQLGNLFDCQYAPTIKAGARFNGGGQVFEILEDVDFKVPYNSAGISDRTEDAIGAPNTTAYRLTKNVFAVNGETRIYSRYIRTSDVKPFFEIILPETNVISIEQIIEMPGNVTTIPSIDSFFDDTKSWYEVEYLAQGEVFVEGSPQLIPQVGLSTGTTYTSVVPGQWKKVSKKFITEYTDNGYLKIIFGSGRPSKTYDDDSTKFPELLGVYNNMINNNALGSTPNPNTTLFVRYRVGGGSATNLGVGVINNINSIDWTFGGNDTAVQQSVKSTLRVTNTYPALGGSDSPSLEEIRRTISYNFGAQERGVQLKDYIALINEMPTRFGKAYKYNVIQERDAIVVYSLTLDPTGKLDFIGTNNIILSNMAEYLSNYRMLNDYVKVKWGKVINLKFEVDVLVTKSVNKSDVASKIGQSIKNYFEIANQDMGQSMFIGKLYQNIVQDLGNSILTILDIRAYNPINNGYSNQGYISSYIVDPLGVRLIDTSTTGSNGVLFGQADSMFEIRNDQDIVINVSTLNFEF